MVCNCSSRGAGANLIHSALITLMWRNSVKKKALQTLQTAKSSGFKSEIYLVRLGSRSPSHSGLGRNRTIPSCSYATRHCLHRPLQLRSLSLKSNNRIVALATSSNPDQCKITLQHQRHSKHSRESKANVK